MEYGDNNGLAPWTSIDIVAPEFGHGVEIATSSLRGYYLYESAALREGLSDIWGVMVRNYAKPNDANVYINGGDVTTNGIRNLSNPKAKNHPDTYLGDFWNADPDYFPAHRRSNILSHWFYILAEGKTGTNDLGNSYSIQGIGKEKAAQIVYRAETVYFESNTDFHLSRLYTIKAASDLFGVDSQEAKTACMAWYAVGVGGNSCFPRIIIISGGLGDGDPTDQPDEVDVICDEQEVVYSLLFVEPSANIVWNVSSNLERLGGGMLSIKVKSRAGANGHAYVTATVDGVTYRKDIWIGEPQVTFRYEQTIPFQVYVYIEGLNGTDVTKQGITNIGWLLNNPTGNCVASLDVYAHNNFQALVQANCNRWFATLHAGVQNECGITKLTRNVTSDGYSGGGDPCYRAMEYAGQAFIFPCDILYPSASKHHTIKQFTIHNYMGVHYGTYQNTNILPFKLPLGLYFIKILDEKGNLTTIKYIKQ